MPGSNLDRLRNAYEQWSQTKGGSIDTWLALVGDDIDFGSLAEGDTRVAFTTRRSGREQVRAYLEGLVNEWQMVSYDVDQYVVDGDTVVALGRCSFTNRATGKTVDTPKCDVWKFSDGKASYFFEYYDTAALFGAAAPD